jgi:Lar family restriction alleviation protein
MSDTENLKVLPCPLCGGTTILPHTIEGTTCFCCIDCGVATNYMKDIRDALNAWNRRTPLKAVEIGTQKKVDVLSCAFCGNTGTLLHQIGDITFLFCTECGAVTSGDNARAALAVWNRRVPFVALEGTEVCERCHLGDLKWPDGIVHAKVCYKCFWELAEAGGKNAAV